MEGPLTLVKNLIETLEEERNTVTLLNGHLGAHLEALQRRDLAAIEEAAHATNACTARLDQLSNGRRRQARLLAKMFRLDAAEVSLGELADALDTVPEGRPYAAVLRDHRTALGHLASDTQQRCEEVTFGLRFAAQLGEELLQALRGIDVPISATTYNAKGKTTVVSAPLTAIDRTG